MDQMKLAYYELRFEISYLKKGGNEFQDFFSEIMEKCHPGDFQRVRPWGNAGDRKNDGYVNSKGMVCQGYGHKNMRAGNAIAKINADFNGALLYWEKYFDRWILVHNSRQGLGPDVIELLNELTTCHESVTAHSWGFEELRQKVFTFNAANLASLLGPAPSSKDMLDVRYDNVQEVLRHIARQESPTIQDVRPVPPDKLKFNRLSAYVQNLLTWGMQKADLVEQFFNGHSNPTYGDEIAVAFKNEYEKYRRLGLDPDIIFCKLQEFTGGSERGTPTDEAAVLAVLAYLFEQCDIFERSPEEVKHHDPSYQAS